MNALSCFNVLTDSQLVEMLEATDKDNRTEIPTVRGWIMDEIEKRHPKSFFAWLDGDSTIPLRKYILN